MCDRKLRTDFDVIGDQSMLIYITIPIYCFREPERQDTLHSFDKIVLYHSIPHRLFSL